MRIYEFGGGRPWAVVGAGGWREVAMFSLLSGLPEVVGDRERGGRKAKGKTFISGGKSHEAQEHLAQGRSQEGSEEGRWGRSSWGDGRLLGLGSAVVIFVLARDFLQVCKVCSHCLQSSRQLKDLYISRSIHVIQGATQGHEQHAHATV
ncbi:stress induced protein [Actinidia rufa]|uniref:Stress induced protein n=1 Tax=Actinidia rufa TaxID=165716 RepID=A0A7J0H9K0_9ERIC|nr:stress induced protein [Actinidia rufa]